jgi:hemolysin III
MGKITKEETANTLSHALGVLMSLPITLILLSDNASRSWQSTFALCVFCASVLCMYLASSVYHLAKPGRLKRFLRYIDHINIYVLIAASYTPILLIAVGGTLGWAFFGAMWLLALIGTFYKVFFLGKQPRLSLALYLLMGWAGLFIAVPVWHALPAMSLWMLLAEGLSYTTGTYFFARDTTHPYYHALWHLFVLGGTLFHFLSLHYLLLA